MRGMEHFCGLYSPSTYRLVVAGTHLREVNKAFTVDKSHPAPELNVPDLTFSIISILDVKLNRENARLELYDLFVKNGGSGAAGACKGAARDGCWEHPMGFGSDPLRDSTHAVIQP